MDKKVFFVQLAQIQSLQVKQLTYFNKYNLFITEIYFIK